MPTYGGTSQRTIFDPPQQLNPVTYYGSMASLLQSSTVNFPASTRAFEKDYKPASVYNFIFSAEHQLPSNILLNVAYVGNRGRHIIQGMNINQIPYGARFLPQNQDPTTGGALPSVFLRPYRGYGSIRELIYNGISSYNSLQASANRRFTRGVQFGVSYTYAKTMNLGGNDGSGLARYIPWRVWNWALANTDQTHIFTLNYIGQTPKASSHFSSSGAQFVSRQIFDNWTLAGVTTFASGFPYPVGLSTTDNADITGSVNWWCDWGISTLGIWQVTQFDLATGRGRLTEVITCGISSIVVTWRRVCPFRSSHRQEASGWQPASQSLAAQGGNPSCPWSSPLF
jgi:hypothetical protein